MKIPSVRDPELRRGGPDRDVAELRRSCPVAMQPEVGFWAVTYSSAPCVLIGDLKRTVAAADPIPSARPDSAEWLKFDRILS
jgi:hypothetical protein